jgi:hypothetical protein
MMLLSAASSAADWITLDLTGLFTILACWLLGAGYAIAALAFGISAIANRSRGARPRRVGQAVLCCALAPIFGLLLPLLQSGLDKGAAEIVDDLVIFWAPGLATAAGFFVRRLGRQP